MKTNFLILLFIVVATISCDNRSVEIQTEYGATLEMKIATSSTVRVNDISYSDYLLKIRNSELEINTDADLIVVKLIDGDGTVRILPQGIQATVDGYQIASQNRLQQIANRQVDSTHHRSWVTINVGRKISTTLHPAFINILHFDTRFSKL